MQRPCIQLVSNLSPATEPRAALTSRIKPSLNGALSALILVLFGISTAVSAAAGPGDPVPDFLGKDQAGIDIRITNFSQKVVIVSFWAEWCTPCLRELPILAEIQDQAGPDALAVVAINLEGDQGEIPRMKEYLGDGAFIFTRDPNGKIFRRFGVKGIPYTALVDRSGKIAFVHQGFGDKSVDLLEDQVNSLLPDGSENIELATPAAAREFPGPPLTRFFINLKNEADRAYERGSFEYAYRLYLKGLVWRGDKYAQYMVGYMLANGQGVPRDPVAGSAWMHLAAERGHARLTEAYQRSLAGLSQDEIEQANQLYQELVSDFGDRHIVARLVRDDRRSLRMATGSRVGKTSALMLGFDAMRHYDSVHERMKIRMEYLEGNVVLHELELIEDESIEETQSQPED